MDSKLMIWYHWKKFKVKKEKKKEAAAKKKKAAAAKKKKSKGRLYGSGSAKGNNYTIKEDKPALMKTGSTVKLERKLSTTSVNPKKKLSKKLSQTQIFDKSSPSKQPKEDSAKKDMISPAKTVAESLVSAFSIDPKLDLDKDDIIDQEEMQKTIMDDLNQIQEENEEDEKEEAHADDDFNNDLEVNEGSTGPNVLDDAAAEEPETAEAEEQEENNEEED